MPSGNWAAATRKIAQWMEVNYIYKRKEHKVAATVQGRKTGRLMLRNGLFRPPKRAVSQTKTAHIANQLKIKCLPPMPKHGEKAVCTVKYLYKNDDDCRCKADARKEWHGQPVGFIAGIHFNLEQSKLPLQQTHCAQLQALSASTNQPITLHRDLCHNSVVVDTRTVVAQQSLIRLQCLMPLAAG